MPLNDSVLPLDLWVCTMSILCLFVVCQLAHISVGSRLCLQQHLSLDLVPTLTPVSTDPGNSRHFRRWGLPKNATPVGTKSVPDGQAYTRLLGAEVFPDQCKNPAFSGKPLSLSLFSV
jgi:hypothetical protein